MDVFAQRRRRVLDSIEGVALVSSAAVTIRNNDVEHAYRQDSDLYYLTGFDEPDAVLLLSTVHEEHRAILFVRPRDAERELWDGTRAGIEGAQQQTGVDAVHAIGELDSRLGSYLAGASCLYFELGRSQTMDNAVFAAISKVRARGRSERPWPHAIRHPESVWHEMRLHKDAEEVATMRQGVAITAEAHLAAMRLAAPGKREYELDAAVNEVFRRRGCERSAYAPIIGSGPNACVLHYRASSRCLQEGELVLLDAGCEYAYYASDVTRTFPVSGRFSASQRAIYEVVLAAQEAAIASIRPGATIESIHALCVRQLTEGMVALGLLKGKVDELIEDGSYRRYYMHRTSHWLGMDVHDVGAYFVDGEARPLADSMVLTVEPGIYVAPDDAQAAEEYRGIGIRIEDDVLVTADGSEILSEAIPKQIDDVESACGG